MGQLVERCAHQHVLFDVAEDALRNGEAKRLVLRSSAAGKKAQTVLEADPAPAQTARRCFKNRKPVTPQRRTVGKRLGRSYFKRRRGKSIHRFSLHGSARDSERNFTWGYELRRPIPDPLASGALAIETWVKQLPS